MTSRFFTISKPLIILVFLFCFSELLNAQPEYWQRAYAHENNRDEFFTAVLEAADKSIYTFGIYEDFDIGQRSYIYKLDRYGNLIFEKKFPPLLTAFFEHVVVVNGNFYSVGHNDSISLGIINSGGDIVSYKNFVPGLSYFTKLFKDANNNLIAVGTYENQYGLIAKFNLQGDLVWYKILPSTFHSYATDVIEVNSNYVFLNSSISSPSDTVNFKLMLTDSQGNIIKDTVFLKQRSIDFKNIIKTDSEYNILGFGKFKGKNVNILYKLDTNFTFKSTTYIDNPYNRNDNLTNAAKYKNGFLINSVLTPFNDTSYSQLKIIDKEGNILHRKNLDGINSNGISNFYIGNSSLLFCGAVDYRPLTSDDDGYLVKTDSNFFYQNLVSINTISEVIPQDFSLSQNYPNPFNPSTKISYSLKKSSAIELKLFDINGRLIKILEKGFKHQGNYEINFSAEGLPSGVYFYSLYTDEILADTKKAIIMK